MLITKDNVTMALDNEDHLNAFLSSGWVEVKASSQTVKAEPQADIEPQAESKEEKITKPRAGRKKQEK